MAQVAVYVMMSVYNSEPNAMRCRIFFSFYRAVLSSKSNKERLRSELRVTHSYVYITVITVRSVDAVTMVPGSQLVIMYGLSVNWRSYGNAHLPPALCVVGKAD